MCAGDPVLMSALPHVQVRCRAASVLLFLPSGPGPMVATEAVPRSKALGIHPDHEEPRPPAGIVGSVGGYAINGAPVVGRNPATARRGRGHLLWFGVSHLRQARRSPGESSNVLVHTWAFLADYFPAGGQPGWPSEPFGLLYGPAPGRPR